MSDTASYIPTERVCGILAQHGVDEATVGRVFAARLQPDNPEDPGYEHDPEKKYALGVPCPGGQALLLVYRFGPGTPLPRPVTGPYEKGSDWRPRWISVEGPFSREEAESKAKELTTGG